MSFRARLALVATAAVALAVVLASVAVYVVVRDQLRGTVDNALKDRAAEMSRVPLRAFRAGDQAFLERDPGLGGAPGYIQVVTSDGDTIRAPDAKTQLPVSDHTLSVADGDSGSFFSDARVSGVHVRVLTIPGSSGFAVQIARPLTEVDDSLGRIRLFLFLIAIAGIAGAAILGLAVALGPHELRVHPRGDLAEGRDLADLVYVACHRCSPPTAPNGRAKP